MWFKNILEVDRRFATSIDCSSMKVKHQKCGWDTMLNKQKFRRNQYQWMESRLKREIKQDNLSLWIRRYEIPVSRTLDPSLMKNNQIRYRNKQKVSYGRHRSNSDHYQKCEFEIVTREVWLSDRVSKMEPAGRMLQRVRSPDHGWWWSRRSLRSLFKPASSPVIMFIEVRPCLNYRSVNFWIEIQLSELQIPQEFGTFNWC